MSVRSVSYLILLILLITAIWAARRYYIAPPINKSVEAKYIGEISTPKGSIRTEELPNSFGDWLRKLPLKPDSSRIRLYNGKRKFYQLARYRVIDLDIGDKNLQQCADVAMRLRADYLLNQKRIDDIAFNFTSGDRAKYSEWIKGKRPIINGNDVSWQNNGTVDSSYNNYLDYLNTVFMFAGSFSLSHELKRVGNIRQIKTGDCFIKGGFPGHVIIVADVAIDNSSGDKYVIFAQGFTPAQDIHIIRNPNDKNLDPWYRVNEGDQLITLEYIFEWDELYSFE